MQDLKVTLIQTELYWQNVTANLSMLEEKIWTIQEENDLIILPEMFNSGFTMEASKVAEPMNLTTMKWMKQIASQRKAVVTGSYIVKEGGTFYNRLIWMRPNGEFDIYDKRHLFRMAGENEVFSSGKTRSIFEIKGWKICPVICYDLRFPVWLRNRNNEYDLLICIANWPASRSLAWKALLQARAIENLAYVAGVNRVGTDGKNIPYNGESSFFSPKGDILFSSDNKEQIKTMTFSKGDLDKFRKAFPAFMDADQFSIED